jgi:hypothetical protein
LISDPNGCAPAEATGLFQRLGVVIEVTESAEFKALIVATATFFKSLAEAPEHAPEESFMILTASLNRVHQRIA